MACFASSAASSAASDALDTEPAALLKSPRMVELPNQSGTVPPYPLIVAYFVNIVPLVPT